MDFGPESVLTDFDSGSDNAVADTVNKLNRALRFISSWYESVDESPNRKIWYTRIDATRKKVEAALTEWAKPGLIFPGNNAKKTYATAQLAYPDMWRQLNFASDLLPQTSILDDIGDAIEDAPGALAGSLSKAISNTLKEIFGELWPWFLVVVIVVIIYFVAKAGLLNKIFSIFKR
jgi:hypothetical protein